MTDFEPAARAAFKSKFMNAEISGCYFHLGQSFWRNIQSNREERRRYKEDPAFALRAKMFMALAFVPNEELHDYWELLLADVIAKDDGLKEFALDYFQPNYIGWRLVNGTEAPARFPYQTWNMFDRIRQNKPRTNNSIEGWHCAMAKDICAHPALAKLAKKYHQEQKLKSIQRAHHLDGRIQGSTRTRRKYRMLTRRLVTLTDRFTAGALLGLPYLEAVAAATYIPT